MATADATILPPPLLATASLPPGRGSARRLDEVGVGTVLGAMIEQKQRRASQPSYPAASEISELGRVDAEDGDGSRESESDESREPSERAPRSQVFVKAR